MQVFDNIFEISINTRNQNFMKPKFDVSTERLIVVDFEECVCLLFSDLVNLIWLKLKFIFKRSLRKREYCAVNGLPTSQIQKIQNYL